MYCPNRCTKLNTLWLSNDISIHLSFLSQSLHFLSHLFTWEVWRSWTQNPSNMNSVSRNSFLPSDPRIWGTSHHHFISQESAVFSSPFRVNIWLFWKMFFLKQHFFKCDICLNDTISTMLSLDKERVFISGEFPCSSSLWESFILSNFTINFFFFNSHEANLINTCTPAVNLQWPWFLILQKGISLCEKNNSKQNTNQYVKPQMSGYILSKYHNVKNTLKNQAALKR